jgi:hypothetical protein
LKTLILNSSGNHASVNTEVFLFPAVLSIWAAVKVFQFIESMLDISVLVSTFVEGTNWLIRWNRVRLGAKNNEFFLLGKSGCINLNPKVASQFPSVETPKNALSRWLLAMQHASLAH